MYWLAKALHQAGVAVQVLTTDRGIGTNLPRNTWLSTDYGTAQYVRTWKNELPFMLWLKSMAALRRTEFLYLASFFYPLSFLLAPAAVLLGKKVIWGPRGEAASSALQFGRFRKKLVLFFIRLLKSHIIFHATSEQEVRDIARLLGKCRIKWIPNYIELEAPVEAPAAPRDLLFLGRLHPIKGLDNLLQALARSRYFRSLPQRLLLAGYAQNGYDTYLKTRIGELGLADKIVFTGRVEGEVKRRLLAGAYALVLPSFSENFGVVVAEALLQGTPVIAATGTPWQILEIYRAGFWVDNDPESLAQSIDRLFALPEKEYLTMRQNARQLAETELDLSQNLQPWLQLLSA